MSSDATLRRLSVLEAAGEVLATSLDYTATLPRVARLAVPVLGDQCVIDVVEDGEARRVASGPDAAGTSRVELRVPLVARGATLGAITFAAADASRRYDPQDVALAEDLARRVALAVDHARLHQRAQAELSERQRAEEALRLSEARFRAVVEQSPLSTQLLAPGGETLGVNRAWEALWGVRLEDIRDYNILADPQLDAHGIAPLLGRAFAGEAVDLPTIRYDPNETLPDRSRHPDPARWVRAFAYPLKDAAGAVREVVLVHEDVTEARRAETRLRASEERLRLALDAGRMNVWDWNLATDVVQCSENAREFWGIDIGASADFMSVIHPDDVGIVEEAARAAMAGPGDHYVSNYRVLTPDGRMRWVQSRGRVGRDAHGRAERILGVTIDITGLKRAEEATRLLADAGGTLGASLDYHATLQDLSRLLVPRFADWCAVDLLTETGTLERVSVQHPDPARVALATELFARYPPRRSDSHGAWRVIETAEPDWAANLTDDILEQAAHDADHLALLRGLDLRSFICVPLIARGAAVGVLTLVYAESGRRYDDSDVELAMDIARRAAAAVDNARLFEQLRAEHRRKDEFLAMLAHELRNPLAPIQTGLALLGEYSDPQALAQTRAVMERQLKHMVRLIDDLLDLSRVSLGKVPLERALVDLRVVAGAAIEASRPFIDGSGVQFLAKLPDRPVLVDGDRTRMAQVVSNLLNNAAKFTQAGGRVELNVGEEAGEAIVRVSDTGAGIPRPMLTHIFEMFAQVGDIGTRTHGGLGIGLTLVRRLVELHDGQVWAESEGPGRGSTFVVRLPLAAAGEPSADARGLAPARDQPAPRRVLVVDDNRDAAEMLAALLALDGHDVRTASNGPAALDVCREFHPEIVFLDIGLPGMNGYELARRLRAEPGLHDVTLVAVTGWGQDDDRRRSEEAGMDHHLTKPVEPEQILALVTQTLRRV